MKRLLAALPLALLAACTSTSHPVGTPTTPAPATWSITQARAEYQSIITPFNQAIAAWNAHPPTTPAAWKPAAITLSDDLHNVQTELANGHWPDTVVDHVTNLVGMAGGERAAWLVVAQQTTDSGFKGALAALGPTANDVVAAADLVRQDLGLAVK